MKKTIDYASKYMTKWLFIATLVGMGGGILAIALKYGIEYLSKAAVLLPLWSAPMVGGFLVCLIGIWDEDALGFGTDRFITAVNKYSGSIKIKTLFSKLGASMLTLGFFGSGGVEGPMVLIGGSLSGILGRIPFINKKLLRQDRRLLAICGAAGAIGAIFRSPLGGGIFVVEILYRSSLHYTDLFPAVLSSTMGFVAYSMLTSSGNPLFDIPDYLPNAFNVPLFILAAVVSCLASFLFMYLFEYMRIFFGRLPLKRIHPFMGGILTGMIFLITPQAAGIGLEIIQKLITGNETLLFLMILLAGKMLATSFTVASGGSAGLVIPALFIGAICGNGISGLMQVTNEGLTASLVISGMSASLASIANVPIAAAVMLTEMVGLRLGVPAALGSILGYAIGHSKVIYGATYSKDAEFALGKEFRKSDRRFEEE